MAEDLDQRQDPVLPRLQRMLDNGPFPPQRDPGHELTPTMPPRTMTGGEQVAETTIDHINKATDIVLDTLERLEAKIIEIREVVQKSKVGLHDAIRAHMLISETAMRGCDQIGQQIVDAAKTLATLNGK